MGPCKNGAGEKCARAGKPTGGKSMSWFYTFTYPCSKVRDFLYDYLEDNLPTIVSIRFHLHLNGCPQCREYLYLYKKAANAKEFRAENPPPPEFLASTLAFLEKQGITAPDGEGPDTDSESPHRNGET